MPPDELLALPSLFGKTFGPEEIEDFRVEVAIAFGMAKAAPYFDRIEHYATSFPARIELSEESFPALQQAGVPDGTLQTLRPLCNRKFGRGESKEFRAEIAKLLGKEPTVRHFECIARYSTSSLHCHEFESDDKFRKYVGFVDLRLTSYVSPVSIGVLIPPRVLRHDPTVFLMTGYYGRFLGATVGAATVYSMNDQQTSGASCAQACAIMAIGFLMDRGVKMVGNHTLTYLSQTDVERPQSGASNCLLSSVDPEDVERVYQVRGLTTDELCRLLKNCKVGAHQIRIGLTKWTPLLFLRIVEAYLVARLPVILAVNSGEWWRHLRPNNQVKHHAVTLIGLRNHLGSPGEASLITHDPGYRPFFEQTVTECVRSAAALDATGCVRMITVADKPIPVHADQCLRVLLDFGELQFEEWPAADEVTDDEPDDHARPVSLNGFDFFVTLANREELQDLDYVLRRPRRTVVGGPAIAPDEFLIMPQYEVSRRNEFRKLVRRYLPRGRYWAIVETQYGAPVQLWIFSADLQPSRERKWEAAFWFAATYTIGLIFVDGDWLWVRC